MRVALIEDKLRNYRLKMAWPCTNTIGANNDNKY